MLSELLAEYGFKKEYFWFGKTGVALLQEIKEIDQL